VDASDAYRREIQELVEFVSIEGGLLGRALHLDEVARAGHDDIHIGVGADVLFVGQVEHGYATNDADGYRRDEVTERVFANCSGEDETGHGVVQRHVSPTDRSGTGTTVGLKNVAVNEDLYVGQQLETRDAAQ
jgi:hypothetical protein